MRSLGAFWLYTLLRFALFGVLWVILWLVGVEAILAAIIALAVSVPLSWFLLAKPRQALADSIEERVERRRINSQALDARLAGRTLDTDDTAAGSADGAGTGDRAAGQAANGTTRRSKAAPRGASKRALGGAPETALGGAPDSAPHGAPGSRSVPPSGSAADDPLPPGVREAPSRGSSKRR